MTKWLLSLLMVWGIWCPDSHAYVRVTTETGAAIFWPSSPVTLDLRVGCPPTGPLRESIWGPCWDDVVKAAATEWNAAGAQFRFETAPPSPEAVSCTMDGLNTVAWISTTCTGPFAPETFAVTFWWYVTATGRIGESATLFNSAQDWSAYPGPWRPHLGDFHRIVLHELGHIAGLAHPDDHGQTVGAMMNSGSTEERLQPDDIAGIRAIYGSTQATQTKGSLENPGPNATKTGIGIISGWVCDASRVEIEVKGTRFAAAYGTDRGDTRSACGDANNGFVVLVNWNNFGVGTHRIRLLADGRELVSRSVSVKTYGTDFLRGRTGRWTLEDWPTAGTDTILGWTEGLQNIEIVDIQGAQEPTVDPGVATLRKLLGTWRVCYGSPDACDEWTFTDDIRTNDSGDLFLAGSFDSLDRIEWVIVFYATKSPNFVYQAFHLDVIDDEFGYGTCEYLWFNLVSPTRFQGMSNGSAAMRDNTCGPIQGRGFPATGERIRAYRGAALPLQDDAGTGIIVGVMDDALAPLGGAPRE